jgi:hypothetical protein
LVPGSRRVGPRADESPEFQDGSACAVESAPALDAIERIGLAQLYKAEQELKFPEIVAQLERQKAAVEWTESTLEAVAGIVNEATSMGKLDAGVLVME